MYVKDIHSQQAEVQRQATDLLTNLQVTGAQRIAAIRAEAQAAAKAKAAEVQMEEIRQTLERKRQYLEEESRAQDGIRQSEIGHIEFIASYERRVPCATKYLEDTRNEEAIAKANWPSGFVKLSDHMQFVDIAAKWAEDEWGYIRRRGIEFRRQVMALLSENVHMPY